MPFQVKFLDFWHFFENLFEKNLNIELRKQLSFFAIFFAKINLRLHPAVTLATAPEAGFGYSGNP